MCIFGPRAYCQGPIGSYWAAPPPPGGAGRGRAGPGGAGRGRGRAGPGGAGRDRVAFEYPHQILSVRTNHIRSNCAYILPQLTELTARMSDSVLSVLIRKYTDRKCKNHIRSNCAYISPQLTELTARMSDSVLSVLIRKYTYRKCKNQIPSTSLPLAEGF